MRTLLSGTNIDAATSDYPKGRVRDKATGINGTIFNEVLMGDIFENIQKLIANAGITENNLPDNTSNGHQILDALLGVTYEVGNDGGETIFEHGYAQGSSYGKLKYRKINGGNDVRIFGSVDGSGGTLNAGITTLPSGFRPNGTSAKYFSVFHNDGSSYTLKILPNGNISLLGSSTPTNCLIDIIFNITDES